MVKFIGKQSFTPILIGLILVGLGANSCGDEAQGPDTGNAAQGDRFTQPAAPEPETLPENPFVQANEQSLSTFSTDVDTASYTLTRRMIQDGELPAPGQVRIEEFINYFSYGLPEPEAEHPIAIHTEIATAPWQPANKIVKIGLKAKSAAGDVAVQNGQNLVFLVDTSGSMSGSRKMPLVKYALEVLVAGLSAQDRIGIVTYSGSAAVVLESTPGDQTEQILGAIRSLDTGGSTNGEGGITQAYEMASAGYIEGGVNRVLLTTDGDFNVGVTDPDELVALIQDKAGGGIYLTGLGFGRGNYQDSRMETLTNHGNGNYAYIDSEGEAERIFGSSLFATLVTVAKDTKAQVEFNPRLVSRFRLIGYENRVLDDKDFNDDNKDAGDMGAGHTVTALYEITPRVEARDGPAPGGQVAPEGVDPLVFQNGEGLTDRAAGNELLVVKVRYKLPESTVSQLLDSGSDLAETTFDDASADFRFACSVAGYGMVLRGSQHRGTANLTGVMAWANAALGTDLDGKRAEFLQLLQQTEALLPAGTR